MEIEKKKKKSQVTKQVKKSFRKIKIINLLSFIPCKLVLIKFFLHVDAEVATTFHFSGSKSTWDRSMKSSKSHITKSFS